MTQHNNTPQVKVNPQDYYSHLNRPGTSVEGDSHSDLSLNHDKGGMDKLTSSPQVEGGAGDSIQKRDVQGGEEYCCFQ